MDRDIRKVRRSIAQRNKTRTLRTRGNETKQALFPFPQEEEKHGYLPTYMETPLEAKQKHSASSMVIKGVLSIAFFFGATFLLNTQIELLSKPKQWTSHALNEEFPFARVGMWYQETFGLPLALMPARSDEIANDLLLSMPVSGDVTESFQVNGKGIMIAPDKPSPVNAWHDGVVIFAGNKEQTSKTIIIQHADNSKSTYGYLSSVDVHLYQFVAANQRIGTLHPEDKHDTVYFSIEKDKEFVDPIQVIEVDDR